MNRLIIAKENENIYVCLFDSFHRMIECHPDRKSDESDVGKVYVGIISNVLKGIEAYFVDYGKEKDGYLSFEDVDSPLSPGQFVTVQVSKDAYDTKGAKLTTRISLAGEHLVLLTDSDRVMFSKKLPEDEHTKELKQFLIKKAKGYGLIVRTNAYQKDLTSIEQEFDLLLNRYQSIMNSKDFRKPRTLLFEGDSKWIQSVQNMNKEKIEGIEVDDPQVHQQLLAYLGKNQLEHIPLQYHSKISLFQKYDFAKAFKQIGFRKVYLSSGASIIIDKTEAMYVIDVNSDKNQSSSKKNILKINLEAAKQIAREIRLRNLSGIIIIDFIDLTTQKDKELLLSTMEKLFLEDPIQTVVHGMTRLGLIEITRKRIEPALDIQLGL